MNQGVPKRIFKAGDLVVIDPETATEFATCHLELNTEYTVTSFKDINSEYGIVKIIWNRSVDLFNAQSFKLVKSKLKVNVI